MAAAASSVMQLVSAPGASAPTVELSPDGAERVYTDTDIGADSDADTDADADADADVDAGMQSRR